jgi:hypothetical protein
VASPPGLRGSRRRCPRRLVPSWSGVRPDDHARDARDVGDRPAPAGRPRRLVPACGRARNRHHHGWRGYTRRRKVKSLPEPWLHEHMGNENGACDYTGQHDRQEQPAEDSYAPVFPAWQHLPEEVGPWTGAVMAGNISTPVDDASPAVLTLSNQKSAEIPVIIPAGGRVRQREEALCR